MAIRKVISIEDGNSSTSIIKANKDRSYIDIDLSFNKKPSGDIYKKSDIQSVRQAVKNLLLTNYYEKPFDLFFGANVSGMLFELADNNTSRDIRKNIQDAIEFYEPRVTIRDIEVNIVGERNSINVTVTFAIRNTLEETSVSANLSRLR
jgi:phage baseplate assembly protein W